VVGHFAPAWFIYLDIAGDPLRVTTFGQDVPFASTGDADLDGHTFTAFGGSLLDVSDVSNSESGSDTLQITLSGIVGLDTSLLNDIGDKTKWQGRTARIWFQLYDETGVTAQGGIVQHYTGYMSSVSFNARPEEQTLTLSVENYLAYMAQASNRSYLRQKDYDPADTAQRNDVRCKWAPAQLRGGGPAGSISQPRRQRDLRHRSREAPKGMNRHPQWEARLHALIEKSIARPYEWGRWDCLMFAAEAAKAITGKDHARGHRGKYKSTRRRIAT
jgi:hypothetical protein